MWGKLTSLIDKMKDPDAQSSVLPLIVVITFLSIGMIVGIIQLVRMLRTPTTSDPDETLQANKDNVLIILNRKSKRRNFLRRIFVWNDGGGHGTSSSELDFLRDQIRKLEEENAGVRELHAKSLRRIIELQDEIKRYETQLEEGKRIADTSNARRLKIQRKAEHIENQLHEVIAEVERIYRQNAQVTEMQQLTGRLGSMLQSVHLDDGQETAHETKAVEKPSEAAPDVVLRDKLVMQQAAEIDRLKGLLLVCRKRIEDLMTHSERKVG